MAWKAHVVMCILGANCISGVVDGTYDSKAECTRAAEAKISGMKRDEFPRIVFSNYKCIEENANEGRSISAYIPIPQPVWSRYETIPKLRT